MWRTLLQHLQPQQSYDLNTLATALGVEPAVIEQTLCDLQAMHAPLQEIEPEQYQLTRALACLDALTLCATLPSAGHCMVLDQVDSTNQYLLDHAQANGISLCAAEYQHAGRGQRGRHWLSPFASGLCLSWQQRRPLADLAQLSLAVAVNIIEVLESYGASELGLKWPNDIVWRGRKLAGLLLETKTCGAQTDVVIGLGMNVDLRGYTFDLDQAWIDVAQVVVGDCPSRNALATAISRAVVNVLQANDVYVWQPRWQTYDVLQQRQIQLCMPDGRQATVFAHGIAADGGLQVHIDGQAHTFRQGEVRLWQ